MADKTLKKLEDSELDVVTGGGTDHDKWIPIETVSSPIFRSPDSGQSATGDTAPTVSTSLTFEEVKTTYKTQS